MPTIGLTCNFYNEIHALPGWIETHIGFFDEIRAYHAGPQGAYSDDGSIELLKNWNIPITFGSIDEGFGVVRTKAIREMKTDYVMLLDCDERFYPVHRVLTCLGQGTPQHEVDWILQSYDFRDCNLPNWENVAKLGENLRVEVGQEHDQGAYLRRVVNEGFFDAIITVRRHWHDMTMRRPTQSWVEHPDWQLRCVRNDPSIGFDPATRMHERLAGVRSPYRADTTHGPFFDHFHFTFKRMEQDQRRHDIAIYDAIHAGRKPPTKEEFWSK